MQFSYVPGFYTMYKKNLVEQTRFSDSYIKTMYEVLYMCELSLIEPAPLSPKVTYFFNIFNIKHL